MRDLVTVLVEYPYGQERRIDGYVIKDITDELQSYADAGVSLERDGMSGVMTEIAYSLKFTKDEKTLILKKFYNYFINAKRCDFFTGSSNLTEIPYSYADEGDYHSYPDFLDKEANGDAGYTPTLKGINKNGLNDLQEQNADEADDLGQVIGIKGWDMRILIGFGKDEAIEKVDYNSESNNRLENVDKSGFFKYLILNLNYETFKESISAYEIEATAPSLQRKIKSSGDDDCAINVSDLETVPFVVDKGINIPVYGDHTFPYYKPAEGATEADGVRQSLMSTTNMDDEKNKWYFPSVSFGDEIEGLESGVKNYLTFGDQTGFDIWSHIKNRPEDEYLLKNYSNRTLNIQIKCKFTAHAHWRTDSNSRASGAIGYMYLLKGSHKDADLNYDGRQPSPTTSISIIHWESVEPESASINDLWYNGSYVMIYRLNETTSLNEWKYFQPTYNSSYNNWQTYVNKETESGFEIYQYTVTVVDDVFSSPSLVYVTKLTAEDMNTQQTSYVSIAECQAHSTSSGSRYATCDFDFNPNDEVFQVTLYPQEEVCLGLRMSRVDFNEDEAYSSHFYFNRDEANEANFFMRTYIANALNAVKDGRDLTLDGQYVLLKGIKPEIVLKYIIETLWGFADGLEVHNDLGDRDRRFECNGEELLYSNVASPQTVGDYTSTNNFGITPIMLPVEVLNGKKDPQLHINLKDLLEWYAVSGYEYTLNGNKMILAPREWFYNNCMYFSDLDTSDDPPFVVMGKNERRTIGYDFSSKKTPFFYNKIEGERGTCELSVNNKMCYTKVNIGYDKEDYDVLVGSNDPVSCYNYKTGYEADEDKELDLTSKLRMDFYGMMYWCIRTYDDDYDKQSDDCFIVDAKPKAYSWVDGSGTTKTSAFGFWDDVKIVVNIIQDTYATQVTYYNALRTPYMIWLFMNRRYGLIFSKELTFDKSENYVPSNETNAYQRYIGEISFIDNNNRTLNILKFGAIASLALNKIKPDDNINLVTPVVFSNEKTTTKLEWSLNLLGQTPPLYSLGVASIKVATVKKIWYHRITGDPESPYDIDKYDVVSEDGVDIAEFSNDLIRFVDDNNVVRFGFISKYDYNFYNYKIGTVELLIAYPRIKIHV